MNSWQLVGRIREAPSTQMTKGGTALTKLTVAVERAFFVEGEKAEWDFIDLIAWGNRAEEAGKLAKGQWVEAMGRITTRTWQNQEGEDRKSTDLTVEWLRPISRPPAEKMHG